MFRKMFAGFLPHRPLAVACVFLAGCAGTQSPPAPPIPAYLAVDGGCVLLVGGAVGSEFADAKVTSVWDQSNSNIAAALQDRLSEAGYKTVPLSITRQDADVGQVVALAAARTRCNRFIQVSHDINEDAEGRYFRYDITLMRLAPSSKARTPAGTQVVTVAEFQKSYRYARTQMMFSAFSFTNFAATVASDLKASGKLENAR